jgi:hypothetical protein
VNEQLLEADLGARRRGVAPSVALLIADRAARGPLRCVSAVDAWGDKASRIALRL